MYRQRAKQLDLEKQRTVWYETYSGSALGGLISAVAELAPAIANRDSVTSLSELLLHSPPRECDAARGRSELNWNGSPLQVLLSARERGWGVRLLGDPGFYQADPLARLSAGRAALEAVLTASDARALGDIAERTLELVVPSDRTAVASYAAGTMWLAMEIGSPGAAFYVAPEPRSARWDVARRWVTETFPHPTHALDLLIALERQCWLLGVGVEGVCPEAARMKFYWRLTQPAPLSSFKLDMFESPSMLGFLGDAIGDGAVTIRTLNFSAAFEFSTGLLRDVKVDVSWDGRTTAGALSLINAHAHSLAPFPLTLNSISALLEQHGVSIGCVGLGLDCNGQHRINTYLFQH